MKLVSASVLLFNLLRSGESLVPRYQREDSGDGGSVAEFAGKSEKASSGRGPSRSKSNKGSGLLKPDCDPVYPEAFLKECESFCTEFFKVCVNPNFFSFDMGWDECLDTCVAFPRTKTTVTRPPSTFVHVLGNTYACRDLHLWEAQIGNDPNNAAFHCSHSILSGGSICADSTVDGVNPYVRLRDGACTYHHYGYCDLSDEDTVADCSRTTIDDDSLPNALKMLPPTVEIIFLNEIQTITKIPSGLFNNLVNPERLKALYIDDCNITDIDEDAFHPLKNLEILNLNFNRIELLQDDLLKLPELKQFSISGDPTPANDPVFGPGGGRKPGMLTSSGFTAKLFQYTPKLERLIMFGHPGITYLHEGMFEGLSKVNTMFYVFCGLTNAGIPDGLWDPLVSMVYFDFLGNQFTELPSKWFGSWSSNIERLVFFRNDIGPITDKMIFSGMPKLKQLYLDKNPRLKTLSPDFFTNNPLLDTFTI